MNFEKKLVILTGKSGKGTALIERSAVGTSVTLSVFSLPDLTRGEYALGVKTATNILRRELGSLGKIRSRYSLPSGDYSHAHLVIFRTSDDEVLLYGACDHSSRMWQSNLMDGLRRKEVEKKTADEGEAAAAAQDFHYSERKIEDYFLDIDRSTYYDGALAEVNYFDYSPASYGEEYYYDRPPAPAESERSYLEHRFGLSGENAGHTASDAEADESNFDIPLGDGEILREDEEREETAISPNIAHAQKGQPKKIKSASEYTVEQAVAAVKTERGFYATVKDQIDELFSVGERYAPLERALPDTRWVKIDYDDKGRYYVVGLVGVKPDYIAYGVPGKFDSRPAAFEGADFIPLSQPIERSDGFWVIFQSAETGKEILK